MAWFFAVRPDATTRAAILEACAAWRRAYRAIEGLRWSSEGKLHYTLRYLGHVDASRPDALEELAAVGRAAAARVAPFEVAVEHVGAFPSETHAKVVWLGAGAGSEQLAAIAQDLDAGVATLGFPHDDRAFTPHLTLARLADRVNLAPLAEAIAARRSLLVGRFHVEALELMESKANVDAYAPLATFPLG
jgi:2'-5' RNA ligase